MEYKKFIEFEEIPMKSQVIDFKVKSEGDFTRDTFPGFSDRLNQLIDMSGIKVSPLQNGRQAQIAELLGVSRPAPSDWLKHDKPPKTSLLRQLIRVLLSDNLLDLKDSAFKVEAWLKYGDDVVPGGLLGRENEGLYTSLSLLLLDRLSIPHQEICLSDVTLAVRSSLSSRAISPSTQLDEETMLMLEASVIIAIRGTE